MCMRMCIPRLSSSVGAEMVPHQKGIAHVHAYVHTKAQLERGCGDGTTPEGDCQNGAGSRHPPAAGTTMHASMSEYN